MIGETAGSYRILRQIGQGGMGAVYLGEHTMLGRPAAIKILLPALSQNREIVARFFNEARATTAIRHPGIVEIYDFGFLPDGAAYIAMEMLDGETLASRLRRVGRLPVGATIDIGRQVAAALHAAHSRGITHRDLKPDNMFLIKDPEIGERVKLLDFGIAKLVTDDGVNRTRTGVVMGTPVYMSPEQCRGTAALDSRADLYSLGCVLYELVTGRPPFLGESAGDIIAHHLYFQPDPVHTHNPSVPEPLAKLIMSLLAKDPAMRPGSAAEVSATLDRWRTIVATTGSSMRASPGMPVAATLVSPVNPLVAAVPTTLSGSAAAMVAAAATSGHAGSSKRWLVRGAISAAVVAAGAIVVVIAMRPEPPATVAATAPGVVAPSAPAVPPPPVPSPATPSPAAPSAVAPSSAGAAAAIASPPPAPTPAPSTSVDRSPPPAPQPAAADPPAPADAASTPRAGKPIDEPPPRKPARVATSSKPPGRKSRDTAAAAPAPREEPKAVAEAAAPAATTPEARPATPAPAPVPEVSQKPEPKPAETGAAAKTAASKWGHLMGDKSVNANDFYLLEQCKQAAAAGDCASARALAARIADKNIAMYRARVTTDPAIAACLRSK